MGVFKRKNKKKILENYTIGELETLKGFYEKQLERLNEQAGEDTSAHINSNNGVRTYDDKIVFAKQIKKDLSDVLTEINTRKSTTGYERDF